MEELSMVEDTNFDKHVPITSVANEGGGTTHTIYIVDEIIEPRAYAEVIDILVNANDNDIVVQMLNTPGGNLDTTIMLLDAFSTTQATTFSRVTGMAASAGSILMLATDSLSISDLSSVMIHFYSGGMYGKGNELKVNAEFNIPYLEKVFHKFYKGFLTKKERLSVMEGNDMYLDAENVRDRVAKREEKRDKEYEKLFNEEQEQADKQLVEHLVSKGYNISS